MRFLKRFKAGARGRPSFFYIHRRRPAGESGGQGTEGTLLTTLNCYNKRKQSLLTQIGVDCVIREIVGDFRDVRDIWISLSLTTKCGNFRMHLTDAKRLKGLLDYVANTLGGILSLESLLLRILSGPVDRIWSIDIKPV